MEIVYDSEITFLWVSLYFLFCFFFFFFFLCLLFCLVDSPLRWGSHNTSSGLGIVFWRHARLDKTQNNEGWKVGKRSLFKDSLLVRKRCQGLVGVVILHRGELSFAFIANIKLGWGMSLEIPLLFGGARYNVRDLFSTKFLSSIPCFLQQSLQSEKWKIKNHSLFYFLRSFTDNPISCRRARETERSQGSRQKLQRNKKTARGKSNEETRQTSRM